MPVDWGINSQLSDHTYAGPPEDAPPTYVVKRDRLALVPWLLTRVIAATVAPDKKKLNAKVSAGQDKFIEKYRLAPPARRWNADEVDRRHRYLRQMISDVWPLLPRPEEKKAEPGTAVHEPNAEELILQLVNKGESSHREFKASFRYDYDEDRDNKSLVTGPIRTTAAFMNSGGGTLLVGVADDGTVLGLDRDLELSTKGSDGLERFYRQSLVNAIGAKFAHGAFAEFVSVEGKTICRIDVDPSPRPVFIERKIEGRIEKDFFIREGGSTRALDLQQAHEYIELHW